MTGTLHAELTADGTKIALMAAGDPWEVAQVTARLDWLTPALERTGTGAMLVPATWATMIQLGWSFNGSPALAFAPREKLCAWYAEQHARRHGPLPELEPSWPPWEQPRDYQVTAARMIAAADRLFFLLDEMGLGKCLESILGIEQRRRLGREIFPLVILVPSWEVADVWEREITRWMPSWPAPVMYQGAERLRHIRMKTPILLSTYATARKDAPAERPGPLARLGAATVICDEASLIQNSDAVQAQAARRIARHADLTLLLSGTLFTVSVKGAFMPLSVGDYDTWPSVERAVRRYCLIRPDDCDPAGKVTGLNPWTEAEFRAALAGQMLRRTKKAVLPELPPKTYTVLRPEIPPEWRQAYRDMEADMLAALPGNDVELSAMDVLTWFRRLCQLASSAADVEWEDVFDERLGMWVKKQKVTLRAPSWKAETLMGVLAAASEPVAVFTESRQLARITGEDYLRPAGLRFGYVTGPGDGVTRRTRQRAVDDFQAGKLDAIVCTAGAGGLGITLTRAPTAVILQRALAFDKAVQPEDRIHRYGQLADKVEIIDVVAKGTADERIRDLMREKGGQWGQFVQDPGLVRELLGGLR